MAKLVAFDSGHLMERGTDVALYDYAAGNEEILGNRSLILAPARSNLCALDRFRHRFTVCLYRSRQDLEALLRDVDLYYVLAHGARPAADPPRPAHGRVGVHCVFEARQPYGDVYAAVSSWVAEHRGVPGVPVVPHIVNVHPFQGDLRASLGIPAQAMVFGRHGGRETFDLPFVHEAVRQAVAARDDLWFLFLNTDRFAEHPRIVHLPAVVDLDQKAAFVNTCDAMLHARAAGETFGLAIAEFAVRNKPVVTWSEGFDRAHHEILGRRGIYYRDADSLRRVLRLMRPVQGDFDAYSGRFSAQRVMRQFEAVFLGAATTPTRDRRILAEA